MPASGADIVDSTSRDWHISDDGDNRGPVTTWPAPVLGPDDRSSTYAPHFDTRRQIFDAYAFLRHEPDAPMVHHVRRPIVIKSDPQGFVSPEDAGWIHDAAGFIDAGFVDAGALPLRDRLTPGQELRAGESLTSKNGAYVVIFQSDGNFVLYRKGGAAIWDSGTAGSGAKRAVMQTDGNFVLYNFAGRPLWDTKTAGRKGAFLAVQNDGNVVIYVGSSPVWTADTAGGVKHVKSSSLFEKIGGAISSVGSGIAHAASDVVKVAAPLVSVVKAVAPFAQTALSFVPGIGTVVNGAIAAGSALAQGKNITDALIDTAAAAIPGGPIAKQAFMTGVNIVKGQSVTSAALDAVRNQIPGGLPAKAAFDTAVAIAHGQSVQRAALAGVQSVARGGAPALLNQGKTQAMSVFEQLSPFATRALSSVGPRLLPAASQLPSLLPTQVRSVAQAVLLRPALRSLPIAELARRMNVTPNDARQGVASVVQAVSRAGGRQVPQLAQAGDLADRMSTGMSFDQAIAQFASRARPPVFSHNRIRTRRRFIGARGFVDAGAFIDAGALPTTIQQGSTGADVRQWQLIIGVKVDGQFGPQTKLATIAWQKSRGLVADGIVGPKTWAVALGVPASASPTTPSAPVPIPTIPIAGVAIPTTILNPPGLPGGSTMPGLPGSGTVVTTLANELPVLGVGRANPKPAVIKWQQIVMVKADGIFGPNTKAATVAWQKSRGLVADGIVGPKTWAAAMTPAVQAPPPPPPPAPFPMPVPTVPVTVQTPIGPVAIPIPTAPISLPPPEVLPPSVTTFPLPTLPPSGGTPPFIPGQVSTVSTPDGPIVGTTDPTGRTVVVTQPTITGSPPSKGGADAIAGLLVLGTLFFLGSSGRR